MPVLSDGGSGVALQNLTSGSTGANSGTAASTQPKVYLGPNDGELDGDGRVRFKGGIADKTTTVDDGVLEWYRMTDTERAAIGLRLYRAGIISDASNYGAALKVWTSAVEEAANFYSATGGQKKITPWQMLDTFEGTAAAGGKAAGPKTTTSKNTSYDVPTTAQAQESVKSIFQDKLGRDPDDGELSRYVGMITAAARKSPTITTTKQTVDANGNSTSSSTSTGGFQAADAQNLLTKEAQADPEYGAYQAAGFYYNALLKALAAPG